uniref:Uncharacterized protein LOC103501624 n=1 Tax=Rhizophora mucronata TaxID=61149 RepID=A0A2P2KC43_RHIMU
MKLQGHYIIDTYEQHFASHVHALLPISSSPLQLEPFYAAHSASISIQLEPRLDPPRL